MNVLHKSGYDIAKAVSDFVSDEGPVLCRDEMEEWSSGGTLLYKMTCLIVFQTNSSMQHNHPTLVNFLVFVSLVLKPMCIFQANRVCLKKLSRNLEKNLPIFNRNT